MSKKIIFVAIAVFSLLSFFGCDKNSKSSPIVSFPAYFPVPMGACPASGQSFASFITDPNFRLQGPDALGRAGDYMLMNDRALFIIQGVGHVNTYYYYSGIPIDAVAINNCMQAGPERFEEMGLMMGNLVLDLANISKSYLRSFRAESVEIINSGANGGDAVIRVHGTDDRFWLTELEMLLMFYPNSILSAPQALDIYIDYILPANSSVMRVEYNIHNTSAQTKDLITGVAIFFGDTTTLKYPYQYTVSSPSPSLSIDLKAGVPWMVSSAGDGAWAFAMKESNMATVNISGVDAVLNVDQVLNTPIVLQPNGNVGDTAQVTYFFSVGAGDYNTATVPLHDVNPEPLAGMTYNLYPFSGTVYDVLSGSPIPDAQIELQLKNMSKQWVFFDGFISDQNGNFGGFLPRLNFDGVEYCMIARAKGRPDPLPACFDPALVSNLDIGLMPGGLLLYDVRDTSGLNIPVKILLWQGNRVVHSIYSNTGSGVELIAPGTYDISITRGYEYTTYQNTIVMSPNLITPLQINLNRMVDTAGYMSTDHHIHAAPSGDNNISIPDRISTVAAEGLEIAISTDHENIQSWQPGIDETGLGDWVATVLGEEASCGIPGHTNIYPIVAQYDINARGNPIEWWHSTIDPYYSMDVVELFAAERSRGAEILQVNHPRGTGIFQTVKYDRATGLPTENPAKIGMRPGAQLWSWDFDAFEYINGLKEVFVDPAKPLATGTFEDWMSFLNLGHSKTAIGGSDAHNYEPPGYPRTFFPSSTDKPIEFKQAELVQAIKQGKIIVSQGAFATVNINGTAGMGDTIIDTDGTVDLYVKIQAIPEIDVTHFKVFVNCDEAQVLLEGNPFTNVPTANPADSAVKFDGVVQVPVGQDSHIVVLVFGANLLPRGFPQFNPLKIPRVTTNAIYVDVDGNGYLAPVAKTSCSYTLP